MEYVSSKFSGKSFPFVNDLVIILIFLLNRPERSAQGGNAELYNAEPPTSGRMVVHFYSGDTFLIGPTLTEQS